jgi:hypothetical protein
MKIRPVVAELLQRGQTDMTKLPVTILSFATAQNIKFYIQSMIEPSKDQR